MIDFIKYELKNTDPDKIEGNPLLEFYETVNKTTGELKPYIYSKYKGLTFKIYIRTEKTNYRRITVEGSIHKFYNEGKHNYNDFGINDINNVLKELNQSFNIYPENCILKQLEIGINITPPIKTSKILRRCLLHKTTPFKDVYTKDEGDYIQARHQRYTTKVYDKRKHYTKKGYKIEKDIMRFEIKYEKMRDLNTMGIHSLKELLNFGLINFTPILLKEWDNILFYDFNLPKNYNKYSRKFDWIELLESYSKLKYHRNKLNSLIKLHPNSIKKEISNIIETKCYLLNK